MSGRSYPRLSVEDFGKHLLDSGDLDPIYIALSSCSFGTDQTARWLIAYWCFYSAAVASYLSEREGNAFWDAMMVAAVNEEPAPTGGRWPRGHERRHFRGVNGVRSIEDLRRRYGARPELMVDACYEPLTPTVAGATKLADVMKRARVHVGFGPWISFKIADMLDRCLGWPVDFDQGTLFMFDDPVEAALMLWRQKLRLPQEARPKDQPEAIRAVVQHLLGHFGDFRAPPFADRPVNIQEVETILCKWKSHMNGHYPLNNDICEIRAGLEAWAPFCRSAAAFLGRMP